MSELLDHLPALREQATHDLDGALKQAMEITLKAAKEKLETEITKLVEEFGCTSSDSIPTWRAKGLREAIEHLSSLSQQLSGKV